MPSFTWKGGVVDASDSTGGFMNTNEWRDKGDGEEGCLMSLVRPLSVTVLLAVALHASYAYLMPALVRMWWS